MTSAGAAFRTEPIIIGLVCDTSGPGASYAVPACNATKLAIDKINSEGGVRGRPLAYVEGNDESDPTKTATVLQKQVSRGASALIVLTSSSGVLQAKPIIERMGVPVIMSVGTTTAVVEPPNNTYLYELAQPSSDWGRMYCEAFQRHGYRKLAVVQDNSPSQVKYNKTLLAAMPCVQQHVETVPIDSPDASAIASRTKDFQPDAVLVASQSINVEVLVHNAFATQLPDVPRFTVATLAATPSAWQRVQPGGLNGVIGLSALTDHNERSRDVTEFYRSRLGEGFTMSSFWAQSYDGVQLLATAIDNAGRADDGPAINAAMQRINAYPASFGYPGFTLSFGPDKHLGPDGLCGQVFVTWGADNRLAGPWPGYEPSC
ncbi:ABC transporter substrate-binding protein [Saccharopolyspora sp. WRP15-2]|uniref:ABC transporter substrate-binding protein n=1 Tax=Saccharopolyspora oryzae TaxID=2997343 RepID=A0ABT4UV02_9PSEU|nr:ABC transporter substrate-binding protein [Saccharopolyspora oryzae]MDA3625550.1 ABC transporter substrate-binding protein [Saccharopolyspora oryzae]